MRKLITDIEEVHHLLPSWLDRDFAFDVETSGLRYTKDKLLGLALYFDAACTTDLDGNLQCGEAYYIALAHTMEYFDGSLYHADFMPYDTLSKYLNILFKQEVLMIAHNAKFDMHFLSRADVHVQGLLADTLLAAHMLDENRQNDLKSLAATVLDMPYAKYDQLSKYPGFGPKEILGVPLSDVADYAMNDVEATWKLYDIFSKQLAAKNSKNLQGTHNLQDVYHNLWMPLLPVLQEMEAAGIALDIDLVREIREEQVAIATENSKKFHQSVTQTIVDHYGTSIPDMYLKPASPEQLENTVEGDDGRYYVEQDDVYLPIITYDMVGRSKTWRPRILTVNTRSSKQMNDIVYNLGGIELPDDVELAETDLGLIKADKDNLETIAFYMKEDTPEFIRYLLDFRKADKFVGTYLYPFEENGDENDHYALHSSLNQTGTKTGRLSSSGPNLLNIPSRGTIGEKARRMFVARPNKKLIVCDYAQAELRMLAHYSLDPALLQAFAEGRDLHILTGAGFARITYEEMYDKYHNGDPWAIEMRRVGKTGNFALTYGMGAPKFQRYLIVHNGYEVSIEQAREWIDGYNETYKIATEWKHGKIDPRTRKLLKPGIKQFILKNGYVVSHAGRFRHLPEVWSNDKKKISYAVRQGINYVIQGSVGDIMAEAMLHIQPALKGLGGTLLLQIYDELVAEVPEDKAELGKEIMEDLLVRYCNPKLRCPQAADAKIANSWGEAKG